MIHSGFVEKSDDPAIHIVEAHPALQISRRRFGGGSAVTLVFPSAWVQYQRQTVFEECWCQHDLTHARVSESNSEDVLCGREMKCKLIEQLQREIHADGHQ